VRGGGPSTSPGERLWSKLVICSLCTHRLTSLGILGTFLGIFIGLADFDVANIDASVPSLLDGLKIAFATSIAGMVFAIAFKIITAVLPSRQQYEEGIGAEELLQELKGIRQDSKDQTKSQSDALERIRASLSSDTDTSIVSQLARLRTSLLDGDSNIQRSIDGGFAAQALAFSQFAEKMAENNSKALIEALKDVIRDFNQKISEQFGDNFKELNVAVGQLLEWQVSYRGQIVEQTAALLAAKESLEKSAESVSAIASQTATIPPAVEELSKAVRGFDAQREMLEQQLSAFVQMKDAAVGAFPLIKEHLDSLTGTMATASASFVQEVQGALAHQAEGMRAAEQLFFEFQEGAHQSMKGILDSLAQQSNNMQEQFSTLVKQQVERFENSTRQEMAALEKVTNVIAKSSEGFTEAVTDAEKAAHRYAEDTKEVLISLLSSHQTGLEGAVTTHARKMLDVVERADQNYTKTVNDTNEALKNQTLELDRQFKAALQRAIEDMGGHLAALSEKFALDYTPLTERLRAVLKVAETLRPRDA
jgi:hypothetical protein